VRAAAAFAAFDWLMSVDPHWYSTIFGVYYFTGGLVAIISIIIHISLHLNFRGILKEEITGEHYHDLGKLLFAFLILWAYMAFSQYFLIWYANIPEETVWYHHRWHGSWKMFSLLLVFGHFVLPFFAIISRAGKRNLVMLGIITGWLLLMRWLDLFFIVYPGKFPEGVVPGWVELAPMLGIGGIFVWLVWKRLVSNPLIPLNDPRIEDSINFVNN